jgi:hypothetical protein
MTTNRVTRRLSAITATGLLVLAAFASPVRAQSATDARLSAAAEIAAVLQKPASTMQELERQMTLQLKLAPEGTRISINEISYGGGRFVVTYALPGNTTLGVLDCPSGWFCFYDGPNYTYPRGRLSDCGWQDLASWGWQDRTESVHNATNSRVYFIEHQDYGNPGNGHTYDYVPFFFLPGGYTPTLNAPNLVDHVNRAC